MHWVSAIRTLHGLIDLCDAQDVDHLVDYFLIHAVLLCSWRHDGEINPKDGLRELAEKYRDGWKHAARVPAASLAKRELAAELVASGALRMRDISIEDRSRILSNAESLYLLEPTIGDPWYPVRTLSTGSAEQLDSAYAARQAEASSDPVEMARWMMLAGAIFYDHGDWSDGEAAYLACFKRAVESANLEGFVVAFETACRAIELRIRAGLCADLGESTGRIERLSTEEKWQTLNAGDVIPRLRQRRTEADRSLAAIFGRVDPYVDEDTREQLEYLAQEYSYIEKKCASYGMAPLRAPALYQLGRYGRISEGPMKQSPLLRTLAISLHGDTLDLKSASS